MKRSLPVVGLMLLVLLIDQGLKIYIKTHFGYNEELRFTRWAMFRFVENEGMAFGISLGGIYGKLALSVFRIGAVALLAFYLKKLLKTGAPMGYARCIGLILAGAVGNILDSMFYGLIFSESSYVSGVAHFVPIGQGYGPFLCGKVVDMFHFPLFQFRLPDWSPLWAGSEFSFFSYIFNVADASIFIGVASILIFHRAVFNEKKPATPDGFHPKTIQTTDHEA